MTVKVLFEPRDLWVGLYWTTHYEYPVRILTLYFCLVPVLPIRLTFVIDDLTRKEG